MKTATTEMIRWGRRLFARHLISGWGGNLSCRLNETEFLITGRHAPLAFLTTKDLVNVSADGKPINQDQHASSETPMHMAIYAGIDAQTIIHVHPPMVIAFSLNHETFIPVSFEEKYTIGEIPIIPQDTPTVTQPQKVVDELKYHPVVIIKGHGTVAIGKTFQDAFLLTDLLEEAVRCQFFKAGIAPDGDMSPQATTSNDAPVGKVEQSFVLFSREHMATMVDRANHDGLFRQYGGDTDLSTSLTLQMEEREAAWTVRFVNGEITELDQNSDGEFLISGKAEWWHAVFSNKIDAFLATQQGKLKLARGELAQLSRWYKPFQRAFALWQTIPIQ